MVGSSGVTTPTRRTRSRLTPRSVVSVMFVGIVLLMPGTPRRAQDTSGSGVPPTGSQTGSMPLRNTR
jgi:hypothetical protein